MTPRARDEVADHEVGTDRELWGFDAVELAKLIASGDVTSREVVEAHLERIDTVNPVLNAVTTALADPAVAGADSADRAMADGQPLGPLHGVPFSVKENIDVAGRRPRRASWPSRATSLPPTRLRWRACLRPEPFPWTAPICPTSPSGPTPTTRSTARPSTPGTRRSRPEAPPAVRARRWRRACRRSGWATTSAARSASLHTATGCAV